MRSARKELNSLWRRIAGEIGEIVVEGETNFLLRWEPRNQVRFDGEDEVSRGRQEREKNQVSVASGS